MRKTFLSASILTAMLLLVPVARAADEALPNINKRGEDKEFVAKLAEVIVPAARSSIKAAGVTVKKFEKKEPKEGRTDYIIKAGFKGKLSKNEYTADIVVHFDTSDSKKWEVLRIEYSDDSKNVLKANKTKVNDLVDKLNKAGKVK